MRVNVASRPHAASPPAVPRWRGLRRSESAVLFGGTSNALRLSGSARPPAPLRRSSSATCQLKRQETEPFCPSQVELLEPSILGIRPEPPIWPAREDLMRESMARWANCVELPLSLRIIKEKKKKNSNRKGNNEAGSPDSICKAFASTVLVLQELQTHALHLRSVALKEDVGPMAEKIQTEVNSSFVWLFREVFSRTPDLMADVMVLTVDFAAQSLEKHNAAASRMMSTDEKKLWDSMVDEASGFQGEALNSVSPMDHDAVIQNFISPIRVEIPADDYDEYYRTELLYQIGVYQEPDNPLLLCNYAQFLCLVTRDYDRAEDCFERAIEVDPTDGEALSQYATFLWVVRNDVWAAEERYQQAMAAEPDNPFHASKYANFLWSTGGDDTCYPI